MDIDEQKKIFGKARKLADNEEYDNAYEILEKILSDGIKAEDMSNLIMSYYGLCKALHTRATREGLNICKEAAKKEVFRSDVFLNLGKMYLHRGTKGKAYDSFIKGLRLNEENTKIKKELRKMGIREKPAIPFLDRSNFLNKWLGIIKGSLVKD